MGPKREHPPLRCPYDVTTWNSFRYSFPVHSAQLSVSFFVSDISISTSAVICLPFAHDTFSPSFHFQPICVFVSKVVESMGLVAPWHVESSQTWDLTCDPFNGRLMLNHQTTREVQSLTFNWRAKSIYKTRNCPSHERASSLRIRTGLPMFVSLHEPDPVPSTQSPLQLFAHGHWLLMREAGPVGRAVSGWGGGSGQAGGGAGHQQRDQQVEPLSPSIYFFFKKWVLLFT